MQTGNRKLRPASVGAFEDSELRAIGSLSNLNGAQRSMLRAGKSKSCRSPGRDAFAEWIVSVKNNCSVGSNGFS